MALPSFSPEAADALPAGDGGAPLDHNDLSQRYCRATLLAGFGSFCLVLIPILEGYGVNIVLIFTRRSAPIESNTYEHFRQRSPAFEIDPIPCVAYMNIVRTVDGHELRLVILEKQFDNSEEFQRQLLSTLTEIREDIATLKDRSKVPKP